MPKKKKEARKETPEPVHYVVATEDSIPGRPDIRTLKYAPPVGREPVGFSLDQARRLAEPVEGSRRYLKVRLRYWQNGTGEDGLDD